jgi:hypothetical protein
MQIATRRALIRNSFDAHGARELLEEILFPGAARQVVVFSVHNGRFGEAILNISSYL